MTRNPPRAHDARRSGEQSGYEQTQPSSSGPPSANLNHNKDPPPQQCNPGPNAAAQSCSNPNNQQDQQQPPGPNNEDYTGPHRAQIEDDQQSAPPPQHQGSEAGSSSPPSGSTSGRPVDDFRTHYEQPHGPMPPNQEPHSASPSQQNTEDRGVVDALFGGAAGESAGHEVHYGILGLLGGALAGSMLANTYKENHKQADKASRSPPSASHSDNERQYNQRGHEPSPGVMAGNFHASARGVRLQGHSVLVAEVKNVKGHHMRSSINLNDCFTNDMGKLKWARGGNFAATARNIRLDEGGKVMEAELGDGRGGWKWNRIYLNERLTNDNGRLIML